MSTRRLEIEAAFPSATALIVDMVEVEPGSTSDAFGSQTDETGQACESTDGVHWIPAAFNAVSTLRSRMLLGVFPTAVAAVCRAVHEIQRNIFGYRRYHFVPGQ